MVERWIDRRKARWKMEIDNGSDRWMWWRQIEPSIAWDLVMAPALCLGDFLN
ncbi:hypothetical protein L195_g049379 [Trifolium pratense]|uniref:Uncharacterized protein n=1 Tax=Trifolium pratense TaxID=57577 RepID=A0A2K3JNY7_TRIPR|nr:hypothetical protein L195_g049379 [Trifolium pratense]